MMRVSRKTFDRMVEAAIESLPAEYARWIDEVPVVVEDRPSRGDASDEGEVLGTFSGPSIHGQGDVSGGAGMPLPPQIMIYRVPLMDACATREQLAKEIWRTLVHELGHYAGMDEEDLDRHGLGDMDGDDVEFDVDE